MLKNIILTNQVYSCEYYLIQTSICVLFLYKEPPVSPWRTNLLPVWWKCHWRRSLIAQRIPIGVERPGRVDFEVRHFVFGVRLLLFFFLGRSRKYGHARVWRKCCFGDRSNEGQVRHEFWPSQRHLAKCHVGGRGRRFRFARDLFHTLLVQDNMLGKKIDA